MLVTSRLDLPEFPLKSKSVLVGSSQNCHGRCGAAATITQSSIFSGALQNHFRVDLEFDVPVLYFRFRRVAMMSNEQSAKKHSQRPMFPRRDI